MSSDADTPLEQACAIPYRKLPGGGVVVCTITSIGKRRWGFPKGVVEGTETHAETALKEADEEAGLRGQIVGESLGSYEDFKWGRPLNVQVFLMRVDDVRDEWPEATIRQREWVTPDEAQRRLSHPDQRRLLEVALDRV